MLKADNKVFGRMLLIGCNRQLDIREVKYPLGPWALAKNVGSLKKTDKAKLGRHV